jgi:hypothetical protein
MRAIVDILDILDIRANEHISIRGRIMLTTELGFDDGGGGRETVGRLGREVQFPLAGRRQEGVPLSLVASVAHETRPRGSVTQSRSRCLGLRGATGE